MESTRDWVLHLVGGKDNPSHVAPLVTSSRVHGWRVEGARARPGDAPWGTPSSRNGASRKIKEKSKPPGTWGGELVWGVGGWRRDVVKQEPSQRGAKPTGGLG